MGARTAVVGAVIKAQTESRSYQYTHRPIHDFHVEEPARYQTSEYVVKCHVHARTHARRTYPSLPPRSSSAVGIYRVLQLARRYQGMGCSRCGWMDGSVTVTGRTWAVHHKTSKTRVICVRVSQPVQERQAQLRSESGRNVTNGRGGGCAVHICCAVQCGTVRYHILHGIQSAYLSWISNDLSADALVSFLVDHAPYSVKRRVGSAETIVVSEALARGCSWSSPDAEGDMKGEHRALCVCECRPRVGVTFRGFPFLFPFGHVAVSTGR